jgi:hypothetical protein
VLVAASPTYASCKSDITAIEERMKYGVAPEVRSAVAAHLAKATKLQPVSELDCGNEIRKAQQLVSEGKLPKELEAEQRAPKKREPPGSPFDRYNRR